MSSFVCREAGVITLEGWVELAGRIVRDSEEELGVVMEAPVHSPTRQNQAFPLFLWR